jgi:phosphatidylglycerophosphate synthase
VLDARLRKVLDPSLDRAARVAASAGLSANTLTATGFVLGMLAVPLLATEHYRIALALVLANRLLDGLDGAVARRTRPTDAGGYFDIVCDFLFYSAVPFGFALARPENELAAAFLIFSFVGTGSSFLAYAAIAAKRGLPDEAHVPKAITYLGGLTEGTETILAFVLFCLLPDRFPVVALVFAALCWLTTASRMSAAWRTFSVADREDLRKNATLAPGDHRR